ncbi:MAG: M4 family metallopeptidase, partial [Candidatus Hydrogenedentota bacterium]
GNPKAIELGYLSLTPTLLREDAELFGLADMEVRLDVSDLFAEPGSELVIYDPQILGQPGSLRLAWASILTDESSIDIREQVLIDAHSGDTILRFSLVHTVINRLIYDSGNTSADPGSLILTETTGSSSVSDVNFAFNYLGDTYDYFFTNHGRDSLDGAGYTLSATVRLCPSGEPCPYQNAFWSGSRMYFGQGFAAADDVVAHELVHGFTSSTSNLIYSSQPGAINEALSDIWGEFIDQTNTGGTDTAGVRWLLGEDVPVFGAIRDMQTPANFGDPDRRCSSLYYSGPFDNQGVHINSGVINKLAYLLTDGDTFNGYTINGMGVASVSDLLYHMQVNLLNASSDFAAFYDAITQAAVNLNYSASDKTNIENACLAVEISDSSPCFDAPVNDECVNAIVLTEGVTAGGTNRFATGSTNSGCVTFDSNDVWYSFTAVVTGTYIFDTLGSSYDTTLAVLDGCGGTLLACNDDFEGLESQIYMDLTGGQTYLVRIAGEAGGSSGEIAVTVRYDRAQVIPGLSFDLSTDPGWGRQGQWAYGTPAGVAGDPASGYTGPNVFGFNLNGAYPDNLPAQYLTTPAFYFTGYSNVALRFKRHLGVEGALYDNASVEATSGGPSWTTVWSNDLLAIVDSSWVTQTVDISSIADNESSVKIRWVMGSTDVIINYHGWNIDDIEFTYTESVTNLSEAGVEFGHLGTTTGEQFFPFKTLLNGLGSIATDGSAVIKIKGDTSDSTTTETTSINTPMRIEAVSGTVSIGSSE